MSASARQPRAYVRSRLLQVVPTVLGVVLVGFFLLHMAPGDPIVALAGENGDADYYAFLTAKYGLDQPLLQQLGTYLSRIIQGDLGTSLVVGRPVATLIAERLPATLLLSGSALLISSIGGVLLGLLQARFRGRAVDHALTTLTLGLFASPVFWVGQLAILGLALRLGWFPIQGMTTARGGRVGFAAILDVAHHLVLPTLVLASQQIAAVSRLTRSGVIAELSSDHVRTARSKGVGESAVYLRHALRRPLLPVVTIIGGRVGHLVAGTVIVETVFGWPGIGRLLLSSVRDRDIPVVLGLFLVVAFTVVLANLVTDLAYARLDPRVRHH